MRDGSFRHVLLEENGRYLIAIVDNYIQRWDLGATHPSHRVLRHEPLHLSGYLETRHDKEQFTFVDSTGGRWVSARPDSRTRVLAVQQIDDAQDEIACVTDEGLITVWSGMSGRRLLTIDTIDEHILRAAFSADGSVLGALASNHCVYVDSETGSSNPGVAKTFVLISVEDGRQISSIDVCSDTFDVAFSNKNQAVLSICQHGTVRLIDMPTVEDKAPPLERPFAMQASFIPDEPYFVVCDAKSHSNKSNRITIHDIETGNEIFEIIGPAMPQAIAFSIRGGLICTTDDECNAFVWSAKMGRMTLGALEHESTVLDSVFGAKGDWLATATAKQVKLWDTATGELMHLLRLDGVEVQALGNSQDGKRVVVETSGAVYTFDVASGQRCDIPRLGTGFSNAYFDKSRTTLFSIIHDNVHLWNSPPPVNLSVTDLSSLSRALTGYAIHDGTISAASVADWSKSWSIAMDNPDNAVALPRKVEDERWLHRRATHAYSSGNWNSAVEYLARLIRVQPDDPFLFAMLGRVHSELRKWENAVADYSKSIELGYDSYETRFGRAYANEELGNVREAYHDCEEAIACRLQPDGLLLLATVQMELDEWREALTTLIDLNHQEQSRHSLGLIMLVLLKLGDHERYMSSCQSLLDTAASRGVTDPNEFDWIVRMAVRTGVFIDYHRVHAIASENARRYPDEPSFQITLGMAMFRNGDYEGALRQLGRHSHSDGLMAEQLRIVLFKSMAYSKSGARSVARELLETVEAELSPSKDNRFTWHDEVELQLLVEEARTY